MRATPLLEARARTKIDLGGQQLAAGDSGSDAAPNDLPRSTKCESLVSSTACAYSGPCSDGSGYLFDVPSYCSVAAGSPQSSTSAAQVATAMVGVWHTCNDRSSTADFFASQASGIEFTNDGHFFLLVGADPAPTETEFTLVRAIDAPPPQFPSGPPSNTGTFEVLDASATLGAGTFQVRLTASSGGTDNKQVIVFGSPARLRFFSPGASDYVRPLTRQYQAHVCGPGLGPLYAPSSNDDLLAHMKGRWARCPNRNSGGLLAGITAQGQGLEFPGDGTWHTLVEDETGKLVRESDGVRSSTIQVFGGAPFAFVFSTPSSSQELEPLVDQCGGLTFNQGNDGGDLLSYEYRRLQ